MFTSQRGSREPALIEAVLAGEVLTCSSLDIEALRVTQDPGHLIPAAVIRTILLGAGRDSYDPRGLRLRGARVTGKLDLRHLRATVGVALERCAFDEDVDIEDAHLPWLSFAQSRLPRLRANRLHVDGMMKLSDGFVADGDDSDGTLQLVAARISGQLDLAGARVFNRIGPALIADRISIGGNLTINNHFNATGTGSNGAIRIAEAHIVGQLSLTGATLTNRSGPALVGEQLVVDSAVFMDQPFSASGHGSDGSVRLTGARVGSKLSLAGARLNNDHGPAFSADGLRVAGDLSFSNGFRAIGCGDRGTIRMTAAHIDGQFDASGAHIENDSGPALHAPDLYIGEKLYLSDGFTARGNSGDATVVLAGAFVGGQFDASGATIDNASGLSLDAQRLRATSDVLMTQKFSAAGGIRLRGAVIGGKLDMSGAKPLHGTGLRIDLSSAMVTRLALPPALICTSIGSEHPLGHNDSSKIELTGLTYTSLDGDPEAWLTLVHHHTEGYSPQPYQQLAQLLKSYGHDNVARMVLRTQQDDLRARGDLGGALTGMIHWTWGKIAGYGYRVRRAAAALAIALFLAAALGVGAGSIHSEGPTSRFVAARSAPASGACSFVERIGLGLDRGLPLASTGVRDHCDLDTHSLTGQVFTGALWLIQLAIWALATLAIAGYTGLIRKLT